MFRFARFLKGATIFSSIIAASCASTQSAQALEPSQFYDALLRTAVDFSCDKASFRNRAQLDIDECNVALEAYAPMCWNEVEPVLPSDSFIGSDEDRESTETRLAKLFVYCVQAHILLDSTIAEMIEEEIR